MAELKDAATSATNVLSGFAMAGLIAAVVFIVLAFIPTISPGSTVANYTQKLMDVITSVFGNVGNVIVLVVLLLAVMPIIRNFFQGRTAAAAAV